MKRLSPAIWNLGVLLVAALPLWIALEWLQAMIFPPTWLREADSWGSIGDAFQMFVLQYLAMSIPVLAGGILHQIVLRNLPFEFSRRRKRIAIVATSPIVGTVLIAITGNPELLTSSRVLIPNLVSLLVYSSLAKPLRIPSETDNTPSEESL